MSAASEAGQARRYTEWVFRVRELGIVAALVLIAIGIAVNLFGAITFGRYWGWYGGDYDRVHLLAGATTIKND